MFFVTKKSTKLGQIQSKNLFFLQVTMFLEKKLTKLEQIQSWKFFFYYSINCHFDQMSFDQLCFDQLSFD